MEKIRETLEKAWAKLEIDAKASSAEVLTNMLADAAIWQTPKLAQEKAEELSRITRIIKPWQELRRRVDDLEELMGMGDESLEEEISGDLEVLANEAEELSRVLRFSGEYDAGSATVRITAGTGGIDAQDFAEMLERMYLRFFEKNGFKAKIVERIRGEEAGIKTSVMEVSGDFAYGNLRSENGVHRLVRLSPFNADNLRQTSFALVEVLPDIKVDAVKIEPNDLKVDVYRAGGHGGQSVNTTDSAVRITHLPTGLTVAIQNERSQIQNRETAMKILVSKLELLRLEQQKADIRELSAGKSASWGEQIRNYVMQPYQLVKDTRTKYEETDVQKVLDGGIGGFVESFLEG